MLETARKLFRKPNRKSVKKCDNESPGEGEEAKGHTYAKLRRPSLSQYHRIFDKKTKWLTRVNQTRNETNTKKKVAGWKPLTINKNGASREISGVQIIKRGGDEIKSLGEYTTTKAKERLGVQKKKKRVRDEWSNVQRQNPRDKGVVGGRKEGESKDKRGPRKKRGGGAKGRTTEKKRVDKHVEKKTNEFRYEEKAWPTGKRMKKRAPGKTNKTNNRDVKKR